MSRVTPLIGVAVLCLLCTPSVRAIDAPSGYGFNHPEERCLSDQQRNSIQAAISQNLARLPRKEASLTSVQLTFPLQALFNAKSDPGVHGISNYVDHDTFTNSVLDYNCGSRSYDLDTGYNHQGVDYFLWPFAWNKVDADEVAVIAAAPGRIILKDDGNFDRSCDFGGDWNAVYIEHDDLSVAWYGHLKENSLTEKEVGEEVVAGEYLGIVASSGSSTGPHLHLEVYDENGLLNDPYAGTCNNLNANSWWESQPAYYNSAVNKLATHSAPPQFSTCPDPDIPNFQNRFVTGDTAYFAAYYRDQLIEQQSSYAVRRPDGSVLSQWSHSSDAVHYEASYWYWSEVLDATVDQLGTWKFQVEYENRNYIHLFTVGPAVEVSGSCPGEITVSVTGATPNGMVGLALSDALVDNGTLRGGACAGTEFDLGTLAGGLQLAADNDGNVDFVLNPPEAKCDDYMQALDVTTCAPTRAFALDLN